MYGYMTISALLFGISAWMVIGLIGGLLVICVWAIMKWRRYLKEGRGKRMGNKMKKGLTVLVVLLILAAGIFTYGINTRGNFYDFYRVSDMLEERIRDRSMELYSYNLQNVKGCLEEKKPFYYKRVYEEKETGESATFEIFPMEVRYTLHMLDGAEMKTYFAKCQWGVITLYDEQGRQTQTTWTTMNGQKG